MDRIEAPFASLRNPDLEREVQTLYDNDLPYHNFQHAITTIDAAESILSDCRRQSIDVDAEVVYYALLFHDAGYHEDHRALGHRSKEAYSADLAKTHLTRLGINSVTGKRVANAILSTEHQANCVTVEDWAVRAADLSGLAAGFDTFYRNSVNLKKEQELLNGSEIEWDDWLLQVKTTVEAYLSRQIDLTDYFRGGASGSEFVRNARANLKRLQHTRAP